jgi:hypothetical protein
MIEKMKIFIYTCDAIQVLSLLIAGVLFISPNSNAFLLFLRTLLWVVLYFVCRDRIIKRVENNIVSKGSMIFCFIFVIMCSFFYLLVFYRKAFPS